MSLETQLSYFGMSIRGTVPEEEFPKIKDILLKWEEFKTKPLNLSPLERNLKPEQVDFIHRIIDLYPDAVFGGSLALVGAGLLDRPIKDIDVFVLSAFEGDVILPGKLFMMQTSIKEQDDYGQSMTTTNVNGKEILRKGLTTGKAHGCIFFVDKEQLQYTTTTIGGKEVKLQNIQHAIAAKKAYAKLNTPSAEKHRADLKQIAENLIN